MHVDGRKSELMKFLCLCLCKEYAHEWLDEMIKVDVWVAKSNQLCDLLDDGGLLEQ